MRRWWTFRVGEEGIRWEKASTLKTESSNVGKEASSAIGRDTAQRNEVVKRNSRRYQRKERLVPVVKPAAVGEDTRAYFNMLTGEAIASPVMLVSSPVTAVCLPSHLFFPIGAPEE